MASKSLLGNGVKGLLLMTAVSLAPANALGQFTPGGPVAPFGFGAQDAAAAAAIATANQAVQQCAQQLRGRKGETVP